MLLPVDDSWPSSPFYSSTLAKVGLRTPWEQWGFFGSAAGSCIYAGRQYMRAHYVMKFVETNNMEHLYAANLRDGDALARFLVNRLRTQGFAAAAMTPLLWLAWRSSMGARRPPGNSGPGSSAVGKRE